MLRDVCAADPDLGIQLVGPLQARPFQQHPPAHLPCFSAPQVLGRLSEFVLEQGRISAASGPGELHAALRKAGSQLALS